MNFNKVTEAPEEVDVEKNIAKAKSEILKRFDELNSELDKAYHIQETLADRLTGVLTPICPDPGGKGLIGQGESTASPLSDALVSATYKVQVLTEKYTSLIHRLEI